MSLFLAVTGLALRELWISFRLLALVGLLLLSALPTALLPVAANDALSVFTDQLQPFAIALAAVMSLVPGVVAGTLGAERRRGTAGWLVSRAVPRRTIVAGWFASFVLVLVIGLVPAAGLAWLTLGSTAAAIDPVAYCVSLGACAAVGTAAVAGGLLFGALLAVRPGMVVASLLTLVLVLPAAMFGTAALGVSPSPGAPFAALADLVDAARPISDSVRAGGVALAAAAVLLVLASMAMDRADL